MAMSAPMSQDLDPGGFPRVETLVVAGFGLIGGAVARAARAAGLAHHIVAVGRRRESLERARACGLADGITTDLQEAIRTANLAILCQPVEIIDVVLPAVMAAAPANALVIDAGSTKSAIVAAGEKAEQPGGARFVGTHPMAGSDKTGWENAEEVSFRDATTIITVTERTDVAAAAQAAAFWRILGSRVVLMHPRRHDELTALVSHVPHMVAVALVEALARAGEDPSALGLLAGPGLRDTTRVAKGSPELWRQICLHNRESIAGALERSGTLLGEIAATVRNGQGDELGRLLERASELRKALD